MALPTLPPYHLVQGLFCPLWCNADISFCSVSHSLPSTVNPSLTPSRQTWQSSAVRDQEWLPRPHGQHPCRLQSCCQGWGISYIPDHGYSVVLRSDRVHIFCFPAGFGLGGSAFTFPSHRATSPTSPTSPTPPEDLELKRASSFTHFTVDEEKQVEYFFASDARCVGVCTVGC